METVNTVLISLIIVLTLALIFSKQLYAVIDRVQTRERYSGIRIIVRRDYWDVNTGQKFQTWSSARGLRFFLVSLLIK